MSTLRRDNTKTWTPKLKVGEGYDSESYGVYEYNLGQFSDFVQFSPYSGGPDWRKSIRDGLNVCTDLSGTKTEYSAGDCAFLIKKDAPDFLGQFYYYIVRGDYGVVLPPPVSTAADVDEADNIARENLQSKILEEQRAFQSGVFLGEIRQTIRLIRNPTSVLFSKTDSYFGSVKKRAKREKSLKGKQQMVSDLWLQYSFGVAPLLKDIDDAARAASQILTYRMPRKTVHAKGYATGPALKSTISGNVSMLQIDIGARVQSRAEVKYSAQLCVSNDTSQDALESLGLTWGNFVPTVWEIIPYSFLVDYFTNCGKVIDSLAVNHSRINWCVRGQKTMTISELTSIKPSFHPNYNPSGYSLVENRSGPMPSLRRSHVQRGTGFVNAPSLRLKNPFEGFWDDLKGDRKNFKPVNLVALAASHQAALASLR